MQEAVITSQIQNEVEKVSLPSSWTGKCVAELEREKTENVHADNSFAQKARDELVAVEAKLDTLLDMHLDGSLSQAEYAGKKRKLILAKKDLEEKIAAFGRRSHNRFEPMIRFVKEANQAENIALGENPVKLRDFLKKIGSNFRISEQTLSLELKNVWKIPAKYNLERRSRPENFSDLNECDSWRCFLFDVRSYFNETPYTFT